MNSHVQSWLISQLGPDADLTDLASRYDRLHSARAVALEVLHERIAALLAEPLKVTVNGVVTIDNSANVTALERRAGQLLTEPAAPPMTVPAHRQNTYPTPPPVFPLGSTLAWLAAYAGALLGANILTASYGMIPVGFGQTATAGTILAGVALMVRNSLQDLLGRRGVLTAVLIGSLLSALVAPPAPAFASAASVLVAESADMCLYTPLRRHGWVRPVVPATLLGALLDTIVFLTIAGSPLWPNVPGQMVGRAWAVIVPVLLVVVWRTAGPRAARVRRLARDWVSPS